MGRWLEFARAIENTWGILQGAGKNNNQGVPTGADVSSGELSDLQLCRALREKHRPLLDKHTESSSPKALFLELKDASPQNVQGKGAKIPLFSNFPPQLLNQ
eukprot:GFKZ01006122.1.p1 GENE.GFKZ01006122.1~~GFKZ01006122.1.p1  ORF type:complete len:102 (-),score=10.48 GFKZ01006122.1:35-340(-)